MRSIGTGTLSLLVLLSTGLLLAACSSFSIGGEPAKGKTEVPVDIVQDFLAHPHFSTFKTEPADLKWQFYEEKDSQRIVAATFRSKSRDGQEGDYYYLMVYAPPKKGESPERIYGALASIDDPDFDVSGFSITERKDESGAIRSMLTATGLASDPKVYRVVIETSEGRTLTAAMYRRFWMVATEAASAQERVTKTIGYAQDGTILYQHPPFAFVPGSPVMRGPSDIPKPIVEDFYANLSVATGVEWLFCVKEGDETVVGATFKAPGRDGTLNDQYYLMVYGPNGARLRGTIDAIDDPDFHVAGHHYSSPAFRYPTRVFLGVASDPKVAKVVCETTTGRLLEAKTYGRFWIATSECEETETDRYFYGYDAEGKMLYKYSRKEGKLPVDP